MQGAGRLPLGQTGPVRGREPCPGNGGAGRQLSELPSVPWTGEAMSPAMLSVRFVVMSPLRAPHQASAMTTRQSEQKPYSTATFPTPAVMAGSGTQIVSNCSVGVNRPWLLPGF
jgi:hypothetical protein